MGVFRQPPMPTQMRVGVAALFPAVAALIPSAPSAQQMAEAAARPGPAPIQARAYQSALFPQAADPLVPIRPDAQRAAFLAYRSPGPLPSTLPPFPAALFSASSSLPPPDTRSVTQMAIAAYRPAPPPLQRYPLEPELLDYYEADSAVGLGDAQEQTLRAYRMPAYPPPILSFNPAPFATVAPSTLPPAAPGVPLAAYRTGTYLPPDPTSYAPAFDGPFQTPPAPGFTVPPAALLGSPRLPQPPDLNPYPVPADGPYQVPPLTASVPAAAYLPTPRGPLPALMAYAPGVDGPYQAPPIPGTFAPPAAYRIAPWAPYPPALAYGPAQDGPYQSAPLPAPAVPPAAFWPRLPAPTPGLAFGAALQAPAAAPDGPLPGPFPLSPTLWRPAPPAPQPGPTAAAALFPQVVNNPPAASSRTPYIPVPPYPPALGLPFPLATTPAANNPPPAPAAGTPYPLPVAYAPATARAYPLAADAPPAALPPAAPGLPLAAVLRSFYAPPAASAYPVPADGPYDVPPPAPARPLPNTSQPFPGIAWPQLSAGVLDALAAVVMPLAAPSVPPAAYLRSNLLPSAPMAAGFALFPPSIVPPPGQDASRLALDARREPPQPLQRAPHSAGIFPPVVDNPPAATLYAQMARLAYRPPAWQFPAGPRGIAHLLPTAVPRAFLSTPVYIEARLSAPVYLQVNLDTPLEEPDA
jgi:hypothetical protein